MEVVIGLFFLFSSRRRHTRCYRDWSSDVCSSDLHPPEAKLYPGVRFTELTDLRGEKGNSSYLGMGLSARFSRHFALHVDALRESGNGAFTQGPDVVLLTLGGEMYSDFLGGGSRKFL